MCTSSDYATKRSCLTFIIVAACSFSASVLCMADRGVLRSGLAHRSFPAADLITEGDCQRSCTSLLIIGDSGIAVIWPAPRAR
jgi:hypothetical protein